MKWWLCLIFIDSNVIISRLQQHFNVELDSDLTKGERGGAHMATVALENHTAIAGFYWRYGFNMEEFTEKLCKGRMPAKILGFWKRIQPFAYRFKTRQHGLARHTNEEVVELSCQDLQVSTVRPWWSVVTATTFCLLLKRELSENCLTWHRPFVGPVPHARRATLLLRVEAPLVRLCRIRPFGAVRIHSDGLSAADLHEGQLREPPEIRG